MKTLAARVPLAAVLAFVGGTAAVVVTDPAGSATDRLCERHPDHRRCAEPTTAVTATTRTTTTTTTTTPTGFLFADEFNGPGLDTSKWWAVPWCENDNNESYNCKNANNAFAPGDGYLHLRASAGTMGRPTDGAEIDTFQPTAWPPSVVLWSTPPPVHMEARIKYAPGAGLWGAFWPMGRSATPWEMDVSEIRGAYPTAAECHFHTWNSSTETSPSVTGRAPTSLDTTADFHVYWADYTGSQVTMGVDGYTCLTASTANQPVMLRLTNRVGTPGTWGGEGGPPSTLPVDALVDYVRVTAL